MGLPSIKYSANDATKTPQSLEKNNKKTQKQTL
jgi:hypothetical protein